MQIEEVEAFVLKLATDTPYLGALPRGASTTPSSRSEYVVRRPWRSLYSRRYETLLVAVTASDGTVGWGEALAPVGPEIPAAVVNRLLAPAVRGMPADAPRPAWSALRNLMRERGHLVGHQADALAAVDMALWDLAGKLANRSIAALLGGAYRTAVPCYVSGLPGATDPERAEAAADWSARGATMVKLHLGLGVHADLATVAAVRTAAPNLQVAVDAHWAYELHAARRLAAGLADMGASFLEAPLAPEDTAGHRELAAGSPLPIAIGETLRNRFEFWQWLSDRSLHLAQPDVARTGITEAMAIAEIASACHVSVAPHHSVGLAVSQAAGLQVCAAIENLAAFEYQPTSTEVGTRILRTPLTVSPGHIALPDGPGLGIDVDIDAIRNMSKEYAT